MGESVEQGKLRLVNFIEIGEGVFLKNIEDCVWTDWICFCNLWLNNE